MIISISGLIGAGKDTVADYLVENHGYRRFAFSKALKDAVSAVFGWDREMLEGVTESARLERDVVDRWWTDNLDTDIEITPRWVLQNIGTEVMRKNFHRDIWVLSAKRWLQTHIDEKIVIPDARFLNELVTIQQLGGLTTGVYRKLPKKLADFYEEVDNVVSDVRRGKSFTQLNFDCPGVVDMVARCVESANRKTLKLHPSEVQHLVWPRYARVFDNTKNKKHLHCQVEDFLFCNDLG